MRKYSICLFAFAAGFAAFAAEIAFTGGAEGTGTELTEPANWDGGALPSAEDVACISDVAGTDLTIATDFTVAGIKFTTAASLMNISSADEGVEVLPRLKIGGSGVVLVQSQSKDYGLILNVPVEILAEQEWELGKKALKTY